LRRLLTDGRDVGLGLTYAEGTLNRKHTFIVDSAPATKARVQSKKAPQPSSQ
jgi:hypothetical protein